MRKPDQNERKANGENQVERSVRDAHSRRRLREHHQRVDVLGAVEENGGAQDEEEQVGCSPHALLPNLRELAYGSVNADEVAIANA